MSSGMADRYYEQGSEWDGGYYYDYERPYLKKYLADTIEHIAEIRALIEDTNWDVYPYGVNQQHREHLERVLENNYVIKDGLEMSLIQLDQEEAGL